MGGWLLGFLSFGSPCWAGPGLVPHGLPWAGLQSGPIPEASPPTSGLLLCPGGLWISGVQFPHPHLALHPKSPQKHHLRSEFSFYLCCSFFNIYLFLIEIQSVNRGGAERTGDTESEAGSGPRAVSTEPDAGLEPMNCEIMT